ncbi:conserved mitochondrial glyco_rpt_poly domain-containing protein [Andalucia godoyi]|uniref:Conserved mitochondrial glyco_rpt_poly domain-containing protein n=1 Tax=Andalucia godoyi TaxID=505711 RepID=A0A8K0F4L8_ANDGO|nr:conserved mitochondrial glyco_rpt_poly domain-containing protein [Andalucia godoyi]|eukprot:ANDGO_04882.mRNA.1 conserved mitochondrial glyco_rpt_poly domain-containing protein
MEKQSSSRPSSRSSRPSSSQSSSRRPQSAQRPRNTEDAEPLTESSQSAPPLPSNTQENADALGLAHDGASAADLLSSSVSAANEGPEQPSYQQSLFVDRGNVDGLMALYAGNVHSKHDDDVEQQMNKEGAGYREHGEEEDGDRPDATDNEEEAPLFEHDDPEDVDAFSARVRHLPARSRVYSTIESIKDSLRRRHGAAPIDYLSELDKDVEKSGIVLGTIPVEELDRIQAEKEEELRRQSEIVEANHRKDLNDIADLELLALKRLEEDARNRERAKLERERRRDLLHERRMRNLRKSFARAKRQLTVVLNRRQTQIQSTYGILRNAMVAYGTRSGQRSSVDWSKYKRGVEIKIELIRAVKDKVPAGHFVLLTSVYERLGGALLPWKASMFGKKKGEISSAQRLLSACPLHEQFNDACEACRGLVGSTVPIAHDGQFSSVEMRFAQSLYTVAPSKRFMKPYMTFVFELVLLKDEHFRQYNQVVAWAAFPLCDPRFDVVQGKYRVPMMRGGINSKVNSYAKIESELTTSIDNWFANLYFEVIHMPRVARKRKEYDYDREFTANLLGLSAKDREEADADDGEESASSASEGEDGDDGDDAESSLLGSSSVRGSRSGTASSRRQSTAGGRGFLASRRRTSAAASVVSTATSNTHSSDGQKGVEEETVEILHDVVPGLSFLQHGNKESEVQNFFDPESASINVYTRKAKLRKQQETHAQKLERYQFAINRVEGFRAFRESSLKIMYMARAVVADLGLTEWRTIEFWTTWLLIFMLFWARIYSHYFGEWLFLNASGISVYSYDLSAVTVYLSYDVLQLNVGYTVGILCCGYLFNCMLFVLLVGISLLSQSIAGSFFAFGSQFILVFGIEVFLDEILLLIVDAAIGNTSRGDAFMLYSYYSQSSNDNLGLLGVCLTVLLFLALMIFSGFLLYNYILRVHNNGLMHDVYVRLRGANHTFFVPHDMEVSLNELRWIVEKAEAWRGYRGERRKTVVFDYVTKDEGDSAFWERTTHLAVFTMDLRSGRKTVFRQFLRLPDGLVIEVFSSIETLGSEEYSILQRSLLRPAGDQQAGLEDFLEGHVASHGYRKGATANKPGAGSMSPSDVRSRVSEQGSKFKNWARVKSMIADPGLESDPRNVPVSPSRISQLQHEEGSASPQKPSFARSPAERRSFANSASVSAAGSFVVGGTPVHGAAPDGAGVGF